MYYYMDTFLDISRKIADNIKKDIVDNFVNRFPLIVIIDPNLFDPPFSSCFDEYFNITGTSITPTFNHTVPNYNDKLVTLLGILVASLDIFYSIVRIFLAGIYTGIYMGLAFFGIGVFGVLLYETINRRWKIVTTMLDLINLNFIW